MMGWLVGRLQAEWKVGEPRGSISRRDISCRYSSWMFEVLCQDEVIGRRRSGIGVLLVRERELYRRWMLRSRAEEAGCAGRELRHLNLPILFSNHQPEPALPDWYCMY